MTWRMPSRGPHQPVVAGMATMPTREASARRAIASLLPQVSRLWLFLDRFEDPPDYADHPKIRILRSQDHGDLRANGKMLGMALEARPCTYLSVDDDILYPPDFAAVMERRLRSYGGPVVLGLHGSVLRPPLQSYRTDRHLYRRTERLWRDRTVDVIGTDAIAFSTETCHFDVREWAIVNMVDLHFARFARQADIPLVVIRRPRKWVREIAIKQPDSIFQSLIRDDSRQTEMARELLRLPAPALPPARYWWQRIARRMPLEQPAATAR